MLQSALHPRLHALPTQGVSCLLRSGLENSWWLMCKARDSHREMSAVCRWHWNFMGVTRQAVSKKMPAEGAKTRKRLRRKTEITSGWPSRFLWDQGPELLFRYHCWQERAQRSLWGAEGWERGWALGKPWVSGCPTSHVTSPGQTLRGQGASPHSWPCTHTVSAPRMNPSPRLSW